MALHPALATVREAPFIVDVLRAADDLALEASRDGSRRAAGTLIRAIDDATDELTAIAAVHALGRVFDDAADAVLSDLLSHQRGYLREHAAWTLGARLPRLDAIGRLVAVVVAGGFSGMLAQRTLGSWARSAPDHIALALEGAIGAEHAAPARARLVETLGQVPGELAGRTVLRIAADGGEDVAVRVAATAALGDRPPNPSARSLVRALAGIDPGRRPAESGALAAAARLAAVDLELTDGGPAQRRSSGLRIAQLFLHADLDRDLSRAGTGDNGGVATLLMRLGDALAAQPGIGSVITLSRGSALDCAGAFDLPAPEDGHLLAGVPLLRPDVAMSQAWPSRIAAERGIRRALLVHGGVDVLHLRMADVGSLAADAVARELGVPVVFSLAPDPHAVIHALDMSGSLTRDNFGVADEREHYWFRARLVQRLAATAVHNVLFPRPELDHDLRELLGIERAREPQRYTVVPEGIDLAVTRSAEDDVTAARRRPAAVQELADLVAALPADRQGLPLAVTVGRLHPVKGVATVVRAWAGDDALRARCNLLVVGGDLADPSADERAQLALIESIVAGSPEPQQARAGLVLAGHRPNDVVARWLAVAHHGAGPQIGPAGVYVCGSLKEEFGLAILEGMAAGLIVIAPAGGGPATYVEQGETGFLVDTREPGEIAAGLLAGLELAARPGRARRAARTLAFVASRFTVQAMAGALGGVYAGVTEPAGNP